MALVKKIVEGWYPQGHPLLKVGDVIEFDNPYTLLKEGKIVLVDKDGNEISRGTPTQCPICPFSTVDAYELADHIYNAHPKKQAKLPKDEEVEKPKIVESTVKTEVAVEVKKAFKDMTEEEKKAWRIENLKKAREAAKSKKEAALTKQAVSEAIKSNA